MNSKELRLRLAALQGDPRMSLLPQAGEARSRSAAGIIAQVDRAGRLEELGFAREAKTGILVRQLVTNLADLGLQGSDFSAQRLAPLSAVIPSSGPLTITFFDLETTGLQRGSGTVPFLYGWATLEGEGLHVEQWLLPALGQERPLVEAALAKIKAAGLLVTYNGSSYDLPLLRSRMVMAGVDRAWPGSPHLDLLPVVRRLFRHRLDRCSLRRVEETLLGRIRTDDLPGREAPERYWQFLRTQDPEPLGDVLQHNQQDVVSLALVLDRMARHLELEETQPGDWLSLGRFIESRGDLPGAHDAYRRGETVSPPPLDRAAALRRARLLRRQGNEEQARELWAQIWRRWKDPEAGEAICVDLEHRQGDLTAALDMAKTALEAAPVGWDQRFAKRVWRLQARLGTQLQPRAPLSAGGPEAQPERPWAGWLPGGDSYEAWLALRRGGRDPRTSRGIARAGARVASS